MATIRAAKQSNGYFIWALLVCLLFAGQSLAQGPDEARIALLQAKPKAYSVVLAQGVSDDARMRLAALEASQHAPDLARQLVRNGLTDANPAVRFGALVTIGKLELRDFSEAAIDLLKDPNDSVSAAAIFAANRCGREVNLSPLAGMLANGSGSARANAAMLIGQLGDPQAIDMLRDMAGKPMPRVSAAERTWVRLQYAEAMIRLDPDDAEVLGTIRASVYSNLDDVRILAIQILGEVGDQSVRGGLSHIIKRDNPIQIKIAAATSLVRMGDTQAAAVLLRTAQYDARLLRKDVEDYLRSGEVAGAEAQVLMELLRDEQALALAAAEVRAQAAIGLGYVGTKASAEKLVSLLEDPVAVVRVAAASAVLSASR